MKTIGLTQGYKALVDDEDYELVNQFKWYADVRRRKDGSIKRVYAGHDFCGKPRRMQHMHCFVMGTKGVDHEDHNGLNNQKHNLRLAKQAQNCANTKKAINNTSGFKGVTWSRAAKKWMAQIMVKGKCIYLGIFTDIIDAARAHDVAALKHFGEFALTNEMLGLFKKGVND